MVKAAFPCATAQRGIWKARSFCPAVSHDLFGHAEVQFLWWECLKATVRTPLVDVVSSGSNRMLISDL